MSEDVRRTVQAFLKTDTAGTGSLADLGLSEYPEGSGSLAVFCQSRLPEGVQLPFVNVSFPISGVAFDTKDRIGQDVTLDVVIVDGQSPAIAPVRIDRLSHRVRSLLHRKVLSVTGQVGIRTIASGPVEQESDPDLTSRIVEVSVLQQESV